MQIYQKRKKNKMAAIIKFLAKKNPLKALIIVT